MERVLEIKNKCKSKKVAQNLIRDFINNNRMIDICKDITNEHVYYITKLAFDLDFIYPHIEEISKCNNLESAQLKLKDFIIQNQMDYYKLIVNCDDKIKKQIYELKMTEKNFLIAKAIVTAEDQFEAYNIRKAYELDATYSDEFYEGNSLPEPKFDIWYVTPQKHKEFVKTLKRD